MPEFQILNLLQVGTIYLVSDSNDRQISNTIKLSACAKPPYLILPSGIPSPYSIQPHPCPPLIPSQPMHDLPPILPQPMHTFPLCYPSPCMPYLYSIQLYACPSLYSILPCACPLPILSQHTQATPGKPPHNSVLFQPMHVLLLATWKHVSPLTSE